jgi:dTDP-4-amino-4,6-dideoxygalactose transaminase
MSYNKGKYKKTDFPIANKLKDQVISLPIFPTMSTKQIEYVTKQLI